jgi:hypothetical protein
VIDSFSTLGDVLLWALPRGFEVAEVVVQDEYCHDVVLGWERGQFLVYDTT